jgi:hypothetical protein
MIDQYSFGNIRIEGKAYTFDLLVFHDPAAPAAERTRVRENWWRESGHELSPRDMKELLDFNPEIVIIGRGAQGVMKIRDEAVKALKNAGIEGIFQKTERACATFNGLFGKKRIAAGFHLTC